MAEEISVKSRREKFLSAPDDKRIDVISRDVWISCPRHEVIIRNVRNVLKIREVGTAQCLLVFGPGGFGKTSLIDQIERSSSGWGEGVRVMSLANNPSNLKFNDLVMSALGAPILPSKSGRATVPMDLLKYIRLNNIRALVIDEIQTSLTVPRAEQERNLTFLKALSGAPYFLTIIAFGTEMAKNALSVDSQLSRRYEILEIPKWKLDDEFRNFLASWEEALPLKEISNLYKDDLARMILSYSEGGVMDHVVKGIKWAAIQAVLTGEEKITKEIFERGQSIRFGYDL